jgi:hypothetical protein
MLSPQRRLGRRHPSHIRLYSAGKFYAEDARIPLRDVTTIASRFLPRRPGTKRYAMGFGPGSLQNFRRPHQNARKTTLYDLRWQPAIDSKRHLFKPLHSQKLSQRLDEINRIAKEIAAIDYHSIAHSPAFLPAERWLHLRGSPKPAYQLRRTTAFAAL